MKTKLFSLVLIVTQWQVIAGSGSEDFTAHEWGTFTSVQGADGIQLEWNPLVTAELPGFVYDRNKPSAALRGRLGPVYAGKDRMLTRQRMETPVIYFYSDRERTVDVNVQFPQGNITEWYPQVALSGLTNQQQQALWNSGHLLRWQGVQILPRAAHRDLSPSLPIDKSGSHYFAAREAEADFLQVTPGLDSESKPEREQFLFYRGVGSFTAPLQVTMGGTEDYVQLRNTGAEDLGHLYVLNIRKASGNSGFEGKYIYLDRLPAGENKTVKLDPQKGQMPLPGLRAQIMQRMQGSLINEGLQAREAGAMVHTWEDSWFGEEGLRVLYILPRSWTDRVLPLTIDPAPHEIVRVMVGRAEVITPGIEWQLLKQIVRFSESDPVTRPKIVTETRNLGLGRFAEPAVRRVLGKTPNPEFSRHAWNLLEATRTLAVNADGLVRR
jgi:hypothetical protein